MESIEKELIKIMSALMHFRMAFAFKLLAAKS